MRKLRSIIHIRADFIQIRILGSFDKKNLEVSNLGFNPPLKTGLQRESAQELYIHG
jgi:hypothetical protein